MNSRTLCASALLIVLLLTSVQLPAQTFKVICNFTNNPDGANPRGGLVIGGSTLYGTTYNGGTSSNGTVFKVNTDGSGYTVLKNFSALSGDLLTNSDGAWSSAGLALAGDTLYGTTQNGGILGGGTVFKLKTNGNDYTVLKNFSRSGMSNNDGANPFAGLLLSDGTLYGTTFSGGTNALGTVFKLNTYGNGYAVLKHFSGSDGRFPIAGLVSAGNTLYGTTSGGGALDHGTVFMVNTDGSGYAVLKSFPRGFSSPGTNIDGSSPNGGLVLSGSTLYGTTLSGGTNGGGTAFKFTTYGDGYTVLKNFPWVDGSDGTYPETTLVLSGRTLYGTTGAGGGNSGNGTVFKVNTDGVAFAVLKHFSTLTSSTNSGGANPYSGLVLSGSTLYGTADNGGSFGNGTVFSLTLPTPQLQITNVGSSLVVCWQDDGLTHTLQTTTNLASGTWTTVPALNWTNGIATQLIGYQIAGYFSNPTAFFRLQ